MVLKNLLLVFLGGGLGSLCRYALSLLLAKYQASCHGFPVHTMMANAVGCLLIGVLLAFLSRRPDESLRLLFVVGLCGGFTTFSTFSMEVITLFKMGNHTMSLLYMLASLIICILMTILGILIVRATTATV